MSGKFTFTENVRSKKIFSISLNYFSLWLHVVNSHLCPIHVISSISYEITQKLTSFSHIITINGKNCHLRMSRITQMERSEITFTIHVKTSRHITTSLIFAYPKSTKSERNFIHELKFTDPIPNPNYMLSQYFDDS